MASIRAYRAGDLDALYAICLQTGDAGADATALYADPMLLGHLYAGPYGVLEPESCFVLEDEAGVGGYMIGARDTPLFEARLETEWWPQLRARYPDPGTGRKLTRDERIMRFIHRPEKTPARIYTEYPSHLHIDLLPRLQGKGWGARLIAHWLDAMKARGSRGVHLGTGERNTRAVVFYQKLGFTLIARERGDGMIFAKSFLPRESGEGVARERK